MSATGRSAWTTTSHGHVRPLWSDPQGQPARQAGEILQTELARDGFRQKACPPKVPMEDRIVGRIWQAMVDGGLVTGELPPKPQQEGKR
jgi:hypothetical protein